jgi:ABC-type sugar transport system substrate-binding protein
MTHTSLAHRTAAVLAAFLLLALAAGPGLAASKKAKKTASAPPGKSAKFIPGSQETAKERATRLKRECKGRVNAGACEGYTQ